MVCLKGLFRCSSNSLKKNGALITTRPQMKNSYRGKLKEPPKEQESSINVAVCFNNICRYMDYYFGP
jgi:hypothetical protein